MFSVTFEVPVSAAQAYDFIATNYFVNHTSWDPGVVSTEPLDEGPVRRGLRGREVRRFLGTQVTSFEVTEYDDSGHTFALRDDPGVWDLERTYQVEPHRDGARVTFVFDLTPRARWFRLVHPLARGSIHRQVRANMDRLQGLLAHPTPT